MGVVQVATDEDLADAFLTASRALLGLAVQSVAASPVEVTLLQHRLLVQLAAAGESTVGEVAAAMGVNPSNATRHCDRLQRLGLVERRRSTEDARVVRVALTDEGRRVVDAVTHARRQEVIKVLQDMPVADRGAVVEVLTSFTRAAHERTDREWATNQW